MERRRRNDRKGGGWGGIIILGGQLKEGGEVGEKLTISWATSRGAHTAYCSYHTSCCKHIFTTLPYHVPLPYCLYLTLVFHSMCCAVLQLLWSMICICCIVLCIYLMLWVHNSTNWDSDMCRMWAVQCIKASSPTFRGPPPPKHPGKMVNLHWNYTSACKSTISCKFEGTCWQGKCCFCPFVKPMLNRVSGCWSIESDAMPGHDCPQV